MFFFCKIQPLFSFTLYPADRQWDPGNLELCFAIQYIMPPEFQNG